MNPKVVVLVIKGIATLIPYKSPKADFSKLEALLGEEKIAALGKPVVANPKAEAEMPKVTPVTPEVTAENPTVTDRSSACVPCTRSHLSTISGSLAEALRFAREGGIAHSEAQQRLMTTEEEINVMERYDLAPAKIMATDVVGRKVIESYLPRIRKLRQDILEVSSVEDLERVAGEAQNLNLEFRSAILLSKGIDLKPIISLAKKVDKGEMSLEEAKAGVDRLLLEKPSDNPGGKPDMPEVTTRWTEAQVLPIDETLPKQLQDLIPRMKYDAEIGVHKYEVTLPQPYRAKAIKDWLSTRVISPVLRDISISMLPDGKEYLIKRPYGNIRVRIEGNNIKITADTHQAHYEAVRQAISEGKPVPAEVLKDYPELAKVAIPSRRQ